MVDIRAWVKARLETITHTKEDYGAARVGQSYSDATIEAVSRRDDVGYFYTTAIIDMAFKDGFEIQDKDGERVDSISDELDKLNWLKDIKRGVVFERKYGAVTFALFGKEDLGNLESLKPFKPANVDFLIDRYGEFTAFRLTEKIGGYYQPLIHYSGAVDEFKLPPDEDESIGDAGSLDDLFHIVLRPDEYRHQGISVLEPILDIINSRRVILGSIPIHAARVAAGLRVATIEQRLDSAEDTAFMGVVELGISRLEADDMSLILRSGTDPTTGQKWADTFEVLDSDNYDFLSKLEVCHRALSAATGIPVNYWNGIFQGATVGAPAVLELLYGTFKRIQDSWTFYLEMIIKRWTDITEGQTWKEGYQLVWHLQPRLTEKEEAEIEAIKSTAYASYKNAGIMDNEEIRTALEIDEPEKIIERPAAMRFDIKDQTEQEEDDDKEDEREPKE